MPCCETTIQKDSSQLLVQKKKSGKKRKLSRCHKSTVKPNSVNASTDNIVTDIEEENKYTSHGRPCRRERKRQRILAMMDHADNHAIKNDSDDMTVVPSKIATTASKRKNGDAEISYNKETIDIKPAKRYADSTSHGTTAINVVQRQQACNIVCCVGCTADRYLPKAIPKTEYIAGYSCRAKHTAKEEPIF
ncbi:hypothetical protein VKS41_005450 [Umbelopsis sp. WA50703]